MKTYQKLLLVCLAFVMMLCICACEDLPGGTTGTGGGNDLTDNSPNNALRDFVVGDKIGIRVESGSAYYIDYAELKSGDSITVTELFNTYFSYAGLDFSKYTFTIDGVKTDADGTVKKGSLVVATEAGAEYIKPGNGEMLITMVMYNPFTGQESGSPVALPKGNITLKAFFETYITEGRQSFAEFSENYIWYVNGKVANASTVLKAGDEAFAKYTKSPAGEGGGTGTGTGGVDTGNKPWDTGKPGEDSSNKPGEDTGKPGEDTGDGTTNDGSGNNPPTPSKGLIVGYTYPMGGTVVSKLVSMDTEKYGNTLEAFVRYYTEYGSFEESLKNGTWSIDGKLLNRGDAEIELWEKCEIKYTLTGGSTPVDPNAKINISFEIRDGESVMPFSYIMSGKTVSLADFYSHLLENQTHVGTVIFGGKSFDETLENGYWTVDGNRASSYAIITDGAKVAYVVTGEGGDPVDPAKTFTVNVSWEYSDGDLRLDKIIATGESMTLEDFYKLYLCERLGGVSFEESFETIEYTVNGSVGTAASVLRDGSSLKLYIQRQIIVPPVIGTKIDFEIVMGDEWIKQTYVVTHTLPITLADFFELYISNGEMTFEESLAVYSWEVDGSAADAETTLIGGRVVATLLTVSPALPDPSKVKIPVTVELVDPEGNAFSIGTKVIISKKGITLAAFAELLVIQGETFSLEAYDWYVDGELANESTVVTEKSNVLLVLKTGGGEDPKPPVVDPDKSITIHFNSLNSETGKYESTDVTIDGRTDITVYELLKEYFLTDPDWALDNFVFLVGGESMADSMIVDGDYRLTDGESLYMSPKLVSNSMTVMLYRQNSDGNYDQMPVYIPDCTSISLREMLEYAGADATMLEGFDFYLDDKIAIGGDYLLRDGDTVYMKHRVEGGITVFVSYRGTNGEYVTLPIDVSGVLQISLRDFITNYGGMDYDQALARYSFYLNDGMSIDGDYMLVDGDTVYMEQRGEIVPPDDVITVTVKIEDANGILPSGGIFEIKASEISLEDLYIYYLGGSMTDFDESFACGEWRLNGEFMDAATLIRDGDLVTYVTTGAVIPDRMTIFFEAYDENGLTERVPFEVSGREITLREFVNLYILSEEEGDFDMTLGLYNWHVNGAPVDGDMLLHDGFTVYALPLIPEECAHEYTRGVCDLCGEKCPETDRHEDYFHTTESGCCPICGTGVGDGWVYYEILVIDTDGYENRRVYILPEEELFTLDDFLLDMFGSDFAELSRHYEIGYGGGPLAESGSENLNPDGNSWIHHTFHMWKKSFTVHGVRYYASHYDETGNVIVDWFYNNKYTDVQLYGSLSVYDAIHEMSLELYDTDRVYVNGEIVTDLAGLMISEDAYIVIMDKSLSFEGLTVTVVNEITGKTETHFYNRPVWSGEIFDTVFAGVDFALYDYRIGGDIATAWSWSFDSREPLPCDLLVTIVEKTTEVSVEYVTSDGQLKRLDHTITGVLPTLDDYAACYLDASVKYRYFCISGGEVEELQGSEQLRDYWMVIVPASIIPETINIHYNMTVIDQGTFEGTIQISDPMCLAYAIERAENLEFYPGDVFWNEDRYAIRVNGKELTGEKGACYTFLYQDVAVTVTPAYSFHLYVANGDWIDGWVPVKVTDSETTVGEIAEMMGIDLDEFALPYNAEDPISYWYYYGYNEFQVTSKRIDVWLEWYDESGYMNTHSIEHVFRGSFTLGELQEYVMNMGLSSSGLAYDWIIREGDGYETILTDPSTTFYWREGDYCTTYYLTVKPRNYYIYYSISDLGGNWLGGDTLTVERNSTVEAVLSMLGYSDEEIYSLYSSEYGEIWKDHVIERSMNLDITLKRCNLGITIYDNNSGNLLYDETLESFYDLDMTVGDLLERAGYRWSQVTTGVLYVYNFGSVLVEEDTHLDGAYHLEVYVNTSSESKEPFTLEYDGMSYYMVPGVYTFERFLNEVIGVDYWVLAAEGYWESDLEGLSGETVLNEACSIRYIRSEITPPSTVYVTYGDIAYEVHYGITLYDFVVKFIGEDFDTLERNGYWTTSNGEMISRDYCFYSDCYISYVMSGEVLPEIMIDVVYGGVIYTIPSGEWTFENFLKVYVGQDYWELTYSGWWESSIEGLYGETVLTESCTIDYIVKVVNEWILINYEGHSYEFMSNTYSLYAFLIEVVGNYSEDMVLYGFWELNGERLDIHHVFTEGGELVYVRATDTDTVRVTYNDCDYLVPYGFSFYGFIIKFVGEDFDTLDKNGYWTTADGGFIDRDSVLCGDYTILYMSDVIVNPEVMIDVVYGGVIYTISSGEWTFENFLKVYVGQDYWELSNYGWWESSIEDLSAGTALTESCTINYCEGGFVPPVEEMLVINYNGMSFTIDPTSNYSLFDFLMNTVCMAYPDYTSMAASGYWMLNGTVMAENDILTESGELVYVANEEVKPTTVCITYGDMTYNIRYGLRFYDFIAKFVGANYDSMEANGYWMTADGMTLSRDFMLEYDCNIFYVMNDIVYPEVMVDITYNGTVYSFDYSKSYTVFGFLTDVVCLTYAEVEELMASGYWTLNGMELTADIILTESGELVYHAYEEVKPAWIYVTYRDVTYEVHYGIRLYDLVVKFAGEDYDAMEKNNGCWMTEDGMTLSRDSALERDCTITYTIMEETHFIIEVTYVTSYEQTHEIKSGITLGEFLETYIHLPSEHWIYYEWESPDIPNLTVDTILGCDCTIYMIGLIEVPYQPAS